MVGISVIGAAGQAPHREMIFLVTALGLLRASIDQIVVATGLDTIRHDLHASVTWTAWTTTAYAVGVIVALPRRGRAGESIWALSGDTAIGRTVHGCLAVLWSGDQPRPADRAACGADGRGRWDTPAATGIIVETFGATCYRALGLFGSIFAGRRFARPDTRWDLHLEVPPGP